MVLAVTAVQLLTRTQHMRAEAKVLAGECARSERGGVSRITQ